MRARFPVTHSGFERSDLAAGETPGDFAVVDVDTGDQRARRAVAAAIAAVGAAQYAATDIECFG